MSTSAYPSPSLSPATTFEVTMKNEDLSAYHNQRRSSVKQLLMSSSTAVSSPLDALVLALEATADELENGPRDEHAFSRSTKATLSSTDAPADDEEDPNATVPSSPTFFMKKSTSGPSLHQLPTLILPGPVSATLPQAASSAFGLTPGTSPHQQLVHPHHTQTNAYQQRKMSISSQGSSSSSSSSSSSAGDRKSFHCTVAGCDKAFSQMSHLRTHERRCHTGNRPFVCPFEGCERAFTQLGNLKTHERKHTGERPYKCPHPHCDKTFTQLGNLKTHERIHDEVKPFMCRLPGCGKTFSQLGNLKTHTAKMHPDVVISEEELAMRTTSATYHGAMRPVARLAPSREDGVVQVIAHFSPYQRRPIRPQRYETERLLKKIRVMLQHQQRMRELDDASEVSDELSEDYPSSP